MDERRSSCYEKLGKGFNECASDGESVYYVATFTQYVQVFFYFLRPKSALLTMLGTEGGIEKQEQRGHRQVQRLIHGRRQSSYSSTPYEALRWKAIFSTIGCKIGLAHCSGS
jgi:hypothetical protein